MSDAKLFRLQPSGVSELKSSSIAVEKSLQTTIEGHLDVFLGVRFLSSEHSTGKSHAGRIDALGIDENGSPVIIEYKRALNENVINQGLFYLDWLMDHKAEFELLTIKKLGNETAARIDWSAPRLLCIAGDFTKYDEHATKQINRTIELIRYRRYGEEFLLLELANSTTPAQVGHEPAPKSHPDPHPLPGLTKKTVVSRLNRAPQDIRDRFEALQAFLFALGDDVNKKITQEYIAYRKLKNFAAIDLLPQKKRIVVWVSVDPDTVPLIEGFTRDVRKIGHFGTGTLEISIHSDDDLERAKPLILKSYQTT